MDQQTPWSLDLDTSAKTTVVVPEPQQEPQWETLHPADDQRWQLARRIAASSSFARSTLLSNFLLYVCDRALCGKTDEISEHQIGVHVFGRRPVITPPTTTLSEVTRGICGNGWTTISRTGKAGRAKA